MKDASAHLGILRRQTRALNVRLHMRGANHVPGDHFGLWLPSTHLPVHLSLPVTSSLSAMLVAIDLIRLACLAQELSSSSLRYWIEMD